MSIMDKKVHPGFVVGAEVAVIEVSSWSRRFSKRRIAKVRKDGKFHLEGFPGGPEERMWAPDSNGDPKARVSGYKGYHRPHIELWTAEHDAELALVKRRNAAIEQRNKLKLWLDRLDLRDGQCAMQVDKLFKLAGELDATIND
jgi:hypothetical protein